MNETFVPLMPPKAGTSPTAFAGLPSNGQAAASPANSSTPGAAPGECAKPVITLQREGEVVSSIRIQCGCGQVIDVNCVY